MRQPGDGSTRVGLHELVGYDDDRDRELVGLVPHPATGDEGPGITVTLERMPRPVSGAPR